MQLLFFDVPNWLGLDFFSLQTRIIRSPGFLQRMCVCVWFFLLFSFGCNVQSLRVNTINLLIRVECAMGDDGKNRQTRNWRKQKWRAFDKDKQNAFYAHVHVFKRTTNTTPHRHPSTRFDVHSANSIIIANYFQLIFWRSSVLFFFFIALHTLCREESMSHRSWETVHIFCLLPWSDNVFSCTKTDWFKEEEKIDKGRRRKVLQRKSCLKKVYVYFIKHPKEDFIMHFCCFFYYF